MKYVILFVVAIVLVRIDIVVSLGEKVAMMFQSEPAQDRPDAFGEPPVIVRSESNVKLTPKEQYLSFLESFRVTPEKGIRDQAMALFRDHPQIFSDKVLDTNLESRVYSWRDLVVQNEAEVPLFLLDLSNILKGPNKNIITRFFSVVLDINFEMFIGSYPRTKDTVCSPVTLIEAAVPEEEKFPELFERMGIIEEYLAKENLPADRKLYATLCLDALKIYLDKQSASAPATTPAPETPPAETIPETGTTP